jgi:hypothetical protein
MSWTDAALDLRKLLADVGTEKLSWRKPVFGLVNGDNTTFKTFEYRRVTDFTDADIPLGVYVDNAQVSVASDDVTMGEFSLGSAPDEGSTVEATYYMQWFKDDEIETFIQSGANWLGFTTTFLDTLPGLRPSVLQYAAGDAYSNLALRYTRTLSDHFKLEDMPKDAVREMIAAYRAAATAAYEQALKRRDEFYTRQGQALQPLFASIEGHVSDPQPKR